MFALCARRFQYAQRSIRRRRNFDIERRRHSDSWCSHFRQRRDLIFDALDQISDA
jgi:hypothetical protein